MGITIEFRNAIEFKNSIGNGYIKQWPNWTGVIPVKGDTVILHFGDNNENIEYHEVIDRIISGTEPDKIIIYTEKYLQYETT